MIRVRIVAATPVAAAGFEAMLMQSGRCEVVKGSSAHGEVDVVLVQLADSRQAAQHLRNDVGAARVVIADDISRRQLISALHSGAMAIVPSRCTAEELIATIEAAAAGLVTVSPEQLDLLLPAPAGDDADDELAEPLTPRESEVLELLAQGLSNKEIANALHVSEHTVKFHVSSVIAKLGVAGRTEAVTRGLRDGLILL